MTVEEQWREDYYNELVYGKTGIGVYSTLNEQVDYFTKRYAGFFKFDSSGVSGIASVDLSIFDPKNDEYVCLLTLWTTEDPEMDLSDSIDMGFTYEPGEDPGDYTIQTKNKPIKDIIDAVQKNYKKMFGEVDDKILEYIKTKKTLEEIIEIYTKTELEKILDHIKEIATDETLLELYFDTLNKSIYSVLSDESKTAADLFIF